MFLFEYFWTVLGVGTALTAALLYRRLITGEPAHLRPALVTALMTGGLATLSEMIDTPREHIVATCRALARIADNGDMASLEQLLASDFHAQGLDRKAWLERVGEILTQTRLDQVRIRNINVDWAEQERARVTFGATCNLRRAEGFASYLPTRWRLQFVRVNGNWLIETVESIPIPPLFLKDPLANR